MAMEQRTRRRPLTRQEQLVLTGAQAAPPGENGAEPGAGKGTH